jgi:hypothetical protein
MWFVQAESSAVSNHIESVARASGSIFLLCTDMTEVAEEEVV